MRAESVPDIGLIASLHDHTDYSRAGGGSGVRGGNGGHDGVAGRGSPLQQRHRRLRSERAREGSRRHRAKRNRAIRRTGGQGGAIHQGQMQNEGAFTQLTNEQHQASFLMPTPSRSRTEHAALHMLPSHPTESNRDCLARPQTRMSSHKDGKAKQRIAWGYETWDGIRQTMKKSNLSPAAGAYDNPELERAPPEEVIRRTNKIRPIETVVVSEGWTATKVPTNTARLAFPRTEPITHSSLAGRMVS